VSSQRHGLGGKKVTEAGGKRRGAGRPMGAKDKAPRKNSRWHGWAEQVSQRYETNEYLNIDVTNARELLQKIYQDKKVPLRYRIYAAKEAVGFEPAPVVVPAEEEIGDNEIWKSIESFVQAGIIETLARAAGVGPQGAAPAWVCELTDKILEERGVAVPPRPPTWVRGGSLALSQASSDCGNGHGDGSSADEQTSQPIDGAGVAAAERRRDPPTQGGETAPEAPADAVEIITPVRGRGGVVGYEVKYISKR